jgi:hypothetical protein
LSTGELLVQIWLVCAQLTLSALAELRAGEREQAAKLLVELASR